MTSNGIKHIHIKVTEENFDKLKKVKDKKDYTWEDMILSLAENGDNCGS